jgi:2'-hydroxyisoflavone reductase
MKLLILGGTMFLGRHLAEQALAAGHELTLFTRGRRNPELFPQAEKLLGDRDGKLEALDGRRWDAVIDTCGYVPRIVRQSARLLAPAVSHYTFISSISVYADFKTPGAGESYPLAMLADPAVETVDGETYGGLKVLCEAAVRDELPGRALIIRPGLIVGPFDPTDRFTWWPARVARGGEVLAPGSPERIIQFIDVRDLAGWTLRMVERRATGAYNATGLEPPCTMGRLLQESREVSRGDASITWVDERFLLEAGVAPWSELPIWIPDDPENAGFHATGIAKALEAGLTFRPVRETIRDTLAWDAARSGGTPAGERPWKAGLPPEKEQDLLARWARRGVGAP